MDEVQRVEPVIRVTVDEMSAYIKLPYLEEDENYKVTEIIEMLNKKNIRYGIDQEALLNIVQNRIFGSEVLVASGTPKADGIDGSFEFNFNVDFNKKPQEREDGSVDYWTIHAVEIVEMGQVIAVYHPPVAGKNGMTVTGKAILCKPGRPLPPITGKGFSRSADGLTYTADMDGKIDYKNDRIMITNIYEVSGDVDVSTGNIDFRGDVVIHGNVTTGATIKTTGSITVDGTSEGCVLEAGKDIILRGGMIGGEKAQIKAKGNIFAKFIEYSYVEAEGFIEADSAMNSTIISYDRIFFNGKHATVVGGEIYGCGGIEANNFGNSIEIRTYIHAGAHKELLKRVYDLQNKVDELEEFLNRVNIGLEQLDELVRGNPDDQMNKERKMALLRVRISKQADLAAAKEELTKLSRVVDRSKGATIRVIHDVHPGVEVFIDNCRTKVKEKFSCIEFKIQNENIVMESLRGAVIN